MTHPQKSNIVPMVIGVVFLLIALGLFVYGFSIEWKKFSLAMFYMFPIYYAFNVTIFGIGLVILINTLSNGSDNLNPNNVIQKSQILMKSHWKIVIGLGVLTMVPNLLGGLIEFGIKMIPGATETVVDPNFGIEQMIYLSPWNIIVPVLNIIIAIVSAWLGLGYIRALLKIWRNEPIPTRSDLTSLPGMQLLHYAGATILYVIVVILGMIALVIPGIYISIRLSMYNYLIAEGYGAIDALKTSRAMTQGQVWKLIGIGFYYLGIGIVGFLALIVGLIRAIPLIAVAQAGVYNILKNSIQTIHPSREHIG